MRAWSALGEGGFQEETNLSLIALVTEKVLDLPTAVSRWPTCPWGDDRNWVPWRTSRPRFLTAGGQDVEIFPVTADKDRKIRTYVQGI